MSEKCAAKARVRLEIEITLTDSWPQEAAIEQVYRQAKSSAVEIVSKNGGFRIMGEPKVTAIIATED